MKRRIKEVEKESDTKTLPTSEKADSVIEKWMLYISFILSIINLIWAIYVQRNSEEQWNISNLGKVGVEKIDFVNKFKLSGAEAKKIEWGYTPDIFKELNEEEEDVYIVPYELALFNSDSNDFVPTSLYCNTIEEIENERSRLSLKNNNNISIVKRYTLIIVLKNYGATEVKNLNISVETLDIHNGNPKTIFKTSTGAELFNGESCSIQLCLVYPLSGGKVNYKVNIHLSYLTAINQFIERTVPVTYQNNINGWIYGN